MVLEALEKPKDTTLDIKRRGYIILSINSYGGFPILYKVRSSICFSYETIPYYFLATSTE